MQDPSTSANSGTLTVSDEATLIGDVYLFVTSGSTEWPVSVSIADAALYGESKVVPANASRRHRSEGSWRVLGYFL